MNLKQLFLALPAPYAFLVVASRLRVNRSKIQARWPA